MSQESLLDTVMKFKNKAYLRQALDQLANPLKGRVTENKWGMSITVQQGQKWVNINFDLNGTEYVPKVYDQAGDQQTSDLMKQIERKYQEVVSLDFIKTNHYNIVSSTTRQVAKNKESLLVHVRRF